MATSVNLTGFVGGIPSDETGMNVESVKLKVAGKKLEVLNKDGETRGLRTTDIKKTITVSGETTATPTQTVGAAVTIANNEALGGVSTGFVGLDDIELEMKRDGMQKLTLNATQYPLVTAGA